MHCPQPALRPARKAERRHHVERCREIERAEPCTDQPHVVIEREPATNTSAGGGFHRLADRPDVASRLLWLSTTPSDRRAPASIYLDEGDRGAVAQIGGGMSVPPRTGSATLRTASMAATRPRSIAASGAPSGTVTRMRAPHRRECRLPTHELLDLRQSHRRIDRYRHRTGIKNAEKGDEEVGTRR